MAGDKVYQIRPKARDFVLSILAREEATNAAGERSPVSVTALGSGRGVYLRYEESGDAGNALEKLTGRVAKEGRSKADLIQNATPDEDADLEPDTKEYRGARLLAHSSEVRKLTGTEVQYFPPEAFVKTLELHDGELVTRLRKEELTTALREMVAIPAGTYPLGLFNEGREGVRKLPGWSSAIEILASAHPGRRTATDAFLIGCFPVTNVQYKSYLDAHREAPLPPGWWRDDAGRAHHPNGKRLHPIVGVSLREASAYCGWCNLELPTADEWEIAARGPAGMLFPWGNDFEPDSCNARNVHEGTTTVFQYPDGRSGFGMRDAIGNVYEWAVTARGSPVLLGGCWESEPACCLPALRLPANPEERYPFAGFRCCRRIALLG
jgi:formylglycine-generating enzyme required for sulfatase activity